MDLKRKSQYIAPRVGVDIPYLKSYFTNTGGFYVKILEITGTPNIGNPKRLEVGNKNYTSYKNFGYYLLDDLGNSYGLITNITYSSETFSGSVIVTLDMPPGNGTYYISKYYQPTLLSCPTISRSSKRHGELSRIGNINFSLANAEEATYSTATCNYLAETVVEVGSGDPIDSESNIGKICLVKYADSVDERIIIDVDDANDRIFFNDTVLDKPMECSVITNNYYSDDFATYPYIEEQDVSVYEYLSDYPSDTSLDLEYGKELFAGKIQECNDISNTEINFIGYDKENYLTKDVIGNLISESDSVLIDGNTIDGLGNMKPICFGVPDTYTPISATYELNPIKNNMIKLRYVGTNYSNGRKVFVVANHDVNYTTSLGTVLSVPDLYYKNSAGRLCQIIMSGGVGYVYCYQNGTTGDVIVEVDNKIQIADYWYGSGSFENDTVSWDSTFSDFTEAQILAYTPSTNLQKATIYVASDTGVKYRWSIETSEMVIPYGDLGDCVDNDVDSYAWASVGGFAGAGSKMTVTFNPTWNDFDMDYYSIDQIDLFAVVEIELISSGLSSTEKITIGGLNAQIGTTTKTLWQDDDAIPASKANMSANLETKFIGSTSGEYLMKIYEIYKRAHATVLLEDGEIELYASFPGYQYDTWIDGRATSDANPNGGYYLYTHDNDDDSGDTIQNPVGVVEAILRDTTFGMSLSDSDLDLDSFNRASIERSGWETCFQLQNQVGGEELMQSLCEQFACVLYERGDKTAIWAYDSDYPFTCNTFGGDGGDFYTLSSAFVFGDGHTIKTRFKLDNLTQDRSLCGRDTTEPYIAINTSGKLIYEEDGDHGQEVMTAYTFEVGVWYDLQLTINEDILELSVDGTLVDTGDIEDDFSLLNIMRGIGDDAVNDFVGDMEYFSILDSDNIYLLDVRAVNEKPVDTTGNRYLTVTGTVTYDLADYGIFDYYAIASDGVYSKVPIIRDSFRFMKCTDALVNKMIANHYYNNDTGNSQSTSTYTDTTLPNTIEKTYSLDKISDSTTVGYLKDIIFDTNAIRANQCVFQTNSAAMHLELFDIVNIRHPLLRNRFADMTTKKWIITSVEVDTECMLTTITAVELL